MKELENYAKNQIRKIISEYKYKNIESETVLVQQLRKFAKGKYFVPFLEQFFEEINETGITINSKYILKLLVKEEDKIYHRDIAGISGTSYSYKTNEIIMLNEKYDLFIEKGIILKNLEKIRCNITIEYIKNELIAKYPKGTPDKEIIYIFNILDKAMISKLIDEDFSKGKQHSKDLFKEK